jgi:hypothetical protein
MDSADNSNRELALYYADYARNFTEALRIAKREASLRQDVHTVDVYAWILYRSGAREQAAAEMKKVLATGVKSPAILRHAQEIMPDNRNEEHRAWQTSLSASRSH